MDVAIGLIIWHILRSRGSSRKGLSRGVALWMLNPLVVNVSSRGNADCLVALPVVAALAMNHRRSHLWSAVWCEGVQRTATGPPWLTPPWAVTA